MSRIGCGGRIALAVVVLAAAGGVVTLAEDRGWIRLQVDDVTSDGVDCTRDSSPWAGKIPGDKFRTSQVRSYDATVTVRNRERSAVRAVVAVTFENERSIGSDPSKWVGHTAERTVTVPAGETVQVQLSLTREDMEADLRDREDVYDVEVESSALFFLDSRYDTGRYRCEASVAEASWAD